MSLQSGKGQKGRWTIIAIMAVMISSIVQADNSAVTLEPSAGQEVNVPMDSATVAPQESPKFVVLEDRIHPVRDFLSEQNPVRDYSFVALRGQDVLLDFPTYYPVHRDWKVEYNVGGAWELLSSQNKVFKGLQPGAMVTVRVSSINQASNDVFNYGFTFGSYPVLKHYDLKDEPGVLRIPSGYTEPAWLATQAYRQTMLEITFTDTKGAPLAGGVAGLTIDFGEERKLIERVLVSGVDGRASERIELGKCYGGSEAKDFVHKNRGFNTWKSWYKVGDYLIMNVSPGAQVSKPPRYKIGHICTQRLQRTVAPRN